MSGPFFVTASSLYNQGMSQVQTDRKIDYIELPMIDLAATTQFYGKAFGWKFEDYGPDYTSFSDGRLNGGFSKAVPVHDRGVLVVIYASNLTDLQQIIRENGGTIVQEIFSFPGGRRFHFKDPNGNELAVWSEA